MCLFFARTYQIPPLICTILHFVVAIGLAIPSGLLASIADYCSDRHGTRCTYGDAIAQANVAFLISTW
jgi:hypothetical protein